MVPASTFTIGATLWNAAPMDSDVVLLSTCSSGMTCGARVQRWSGVLINGVIFLHGSVTGVAYSIQHTSRAYNTSW
jgi:hypothetical protein